MTRLRQTIFIFLVSFVLNGCATTTDNDYYTAFLKDSSLVEQAKLAIHKKFPSISPDDLILLKNASGNFPNEAHVFHPNFFKFRSKSSTTTLKIKDQSILFFDLVSVGIHKDGTLNPNDRDASITKAVSTVIDPPVKEWNKDELFQVSFFDLPLQSLMPVYASFKGLEFDEYTGPYATVPVTCFTEEAIPQEYVVELIKQTLNLFHVSISLSPENKIIGVYNRPE